MTARGVQGKLVRVGTGPQPSVGCLNPRLFQKVVLSGEHFTRAWPLPTGGPQAWELPTHSEKLPWITTEGQAPVLRALGQVAMGTRDLSVDLPASY